MIKSMMTALLAAASLIPMAANAQQAPAPGQQEANGQQPPRPQGRAGREGGRGGGREGGGWQRGPQGQQPAQPGPQPQAGQPGGFQRDDRGRQPAPQFQRGPGQDGRGQDGRGQDGRGSFQNDRGDRGPYQGQQGRPDQYRGNDNRGGQYRPDQRGNDRGQYRPDPRGQDDRGRDGRGWNDRGRDTRGVWNRDWRGNGQYNYNSYRAQNRDRFHLPRYYAPRGYDQGYRRFGNGIRLNAYLYDRSYWISDPYDYRLPDAYGPYRWVRYYNDALLVDLRSGYVVDTVYGIFW